MEKKDFAAIGNALNKMSRNTYSEKEMAENIETYWAEYQWSKENNQVSNILQDLIYILYADMDLHDYDDTENVVKTVEEMDKIFAEYLEEIS